MGEEVGRRGWEERDQRERSGDDVVSRVAGAEPRPEPGWSGDYLPGRIGFDR